MSDYLDYQSGMSISLGSGYDLRGREIKFSPFSHFPVETTNESENSVILKFIEKTSDISGLLSFGAEGVYDSLAWSASVKTEFILSSEVNTYSLIFLVICTSVLRTEFVGPTPAPTLNSDATTMIEQGSLDNLNQSYGTHFVSSKVVGGSLYGLIKITTKSEQRKQEIAAELNASGLTWEARAEFAAKLESYGAEIVKEVKFKAIGIPSASYSIPTEPSQLFDLAQRFPALVANSTTPIKFELRPLDQVPSVTFHNADVSMEVRCAVATLSEHFLDYLTLKNDILFMENNLGRFDFDKTPIDKVKESRSRVEGQINEIKILSSKLITGEILPSDATVVKFPPAYKFDDNLVLPNMVDIQTVDPAKLKIFPLRFNTMGDDIMAGHRPIIEITAKLSASTKKYLELSVHVKMQESSPNWTIFEDIWPQNSSLDNHAPGKANDFTLEGTGKKIISFSPSEGQLQAQAGENDFDWHEYPGSGLIVKASCLSDTKNRHDAGCVGVDWILLAPIRVLIGPSLPLMPVQVTPAILQKRTRLLKWARR